MLSAHKISEFEASLVYRVSARTVKATERNPVSETKIFCFFVFFFLFLVFWFFFFFFFCDSVFLITFKVH